MFVDNFINRNFFGKIGNTNVFRKNFEKEMLPEKNREYERFPKKSEKRCFSKMIRKIPKNEEWFDEKYASDR